eukprot:606272_1
MAAVSVLNQSASIESLQLENNLLKQKVLHLTGLCEDNKSQHEQFKAKYKLEFRNARETYKLRINELQQQIDNQKQKFETKYNECLELNKLKDQYEHVNDDQNRKIQTYKQRTGDLRDKCGNLEMCIAEIVTDNENLQQMLLHAQTGPMDINSSVNDSKSASTKVAIAARSSSLTVKTSTFEDIMRIHSGGSITGAKGHPSHDRMSLLTRIRSSVQSNFEDPIFQNTGAFDPIDGNISLGNMGSSVNNSDSFRRRKRTINIISIPRGKTSSTPTGMIADNLEMEMEDAAYEEFGDMNEMDQLQEITEQLRVEIQEEMEEELEAQIKNKYDLKMLKLDTTYNEKLMLLHVEIDRLKSANKKQLREMKKQLRYRDANALQYVDDQKTNEEMDDDMDDLGGMSMEDDSDETFDDTAQSESSGEDHWSRREEHGRNDEHEEPLLSEHYDEKKKHKHRKKKKKDKHKKRKKKMGEKAHKDMQKGRFCCTSLWKDYTKIYDEDVASSDHGVLSKEKKKRKKEKKKRRKKEEKKEIVTESHEIDVRINNDENMGFGTDELNDENIEELTKEEEVMTMNDLQMELMKHNEEKEIEIVTHDEENSNKKNRDLSFMDDMVDALKEKSNVEEQEQVVEENSNTENVVSAGNGLVGDASGGVEATQS